MSTRCVINFEDSYGKAKIYRHSDGYPESDVGVLADLEKFFTAVEKQTKDTRFNDPNYLAAKFVVWQANENAKIDAQTFGRNPKTGEYERKQGRAKKLAFLGVGIIDRNPGDIEYEYTVHCDGSDPFNARRPKVTWREVPFGESDSDTAEVGNHDTILTSNHIVEINGVKYKKVEDD